MSRDPSPGETVTEMIEYSEAAALSILDTMSDEDCIQMVREFCELMADWQQNIGCYRDEPVMLGLSCLSAAELFKMAFARAYMHTDKKVQAMSAIQKAFGEESL